MQYIQHKLSLYHWTLGTNLILTVIFLIHILTYLIGVLHYTDGQCTNGYPDEDNNSSKIMVVIRELERQIFELKELLLRTKEDMKESLQDRMLLPGQVVPKYLILIG